MTMFLNMVYSKELILEYYFNCLLLIDYNNNEIEFMELIILQIDYLIKIQYYRCF